MRVLIAVLTIDRVLSVNTAKTVITMLADPRVQTEVSFVQDAPVDSARNGIVKTFLDEGFDYLVSIDDDVGCEKNLIDLCLLRQDIIILPTPIVQNGKIKINVCYKDKGEGLLEIHKGGTGCFILSRKAALELKKPLFKFFYDENGRCSKGEDINFTEQAAKKFKIFTHTDYFCSHLKSMDLLTLGGDFFKRESRGLVS